MLTEREINMGEKDNKPVKFYIKDENGEYIPIPMQTDIPNLELAEREGVVMSCIHGCRFCNHSDEKRKKGDMIRCTRFSQWVLPIDEVCEEYTEGFSVDFTEIAKKFYAERSEKQ